MVQLPTPHLLTHSSPAGRLIAGPGGRYRTLIGCPPAIPTPSPHLLSDDVNDDVTTPTPPFFGDQTETAAETRLARAGCQWRRVERGRRLERAPFFFVFFFVFRDVTNFKPTPLTKNSCLALLEFPSDFGRGFRGGSLEGTEFYRVLLGFTGFSWTRQGFYQAFVISSRFY